MGNRLRCQCTGCADWPWLSNSKRCRAVAPLSGSGFGIGLADTGILIGLYFAPAVALALPRGAIGRRFGDKITVGGSSILNLIGTSRAGSAAAFDSGAAALVNLSGNSLGLQSPSGSTCQNWCECPSFAQPLLTPH